MLLRVMHRGPETTIGAGSGAHAEWTAVFIDTLAGPAPLPPLLTF
jgi:hypothetical protein